MARSIRDLPEELATYKGLTRYRPTLLEWLARATFLYQYLPIVTQESS